MFRPILPAFAFAPLLALVASGPVLASGAQTWVLDPVHTQIVFFADHLGFSHGIGRLKIKQGWFVFDAEDWTTARADVVIDMTSLDMGDADWTAKVAEPAFLDSGNAPTAHFIGHTLEKKTANTGILHGELWLRGIRRDVDLAVAFNRQGGDPYAFKTKAGFSATTTLDRFAFGMTRFRDVVAGPVELRIEVEGIRSNRKEIETDAIEKQ
ncbi:MAG: polyisoprenoid-binding protein [Xanthomonadales bacterium]|nr:polyisoprenoid-binding protein [Xanthomonadales bacterium]